MFYVNGKIISYINVEHFIYYVALKKKRKEISLIFQQD